jgi:hypothetical protein
MGDRRDTYRVLLGRPGGRRSLGRPKHIWEDNFRMEEVDWRGMNWIDVAQDWDRWRALVNAVVSLRVARNAGNFLTSWVRCRFSWRIMIYGVSSWLYLITSSFRSRKFIFFPNDFPKNIPIRWAYLSVIQRGAWCWDHSNLYEYLFPGCLESNLALLTCSVLLIGHKFRKCSREVLKY